MSIPLATDLHLPHVGLLHLIHSMGYWDISAEVVATCAGVVFLAVAFNLRLTAAVAAAYPLDPLPDPLEPRVEPVPTKVVAFICARSAFLNRFAHRLYS